MALNVGINGFGRIGRIIFRSCFRNPSLKVTAINDPAVDIDYICYLIKFDSTHGKFEGTVRSNNEHIEVDGHKIAIFREKLPTNIPWQTANVQYVVEASGMFTNLEKASGHLTNDGVKRVIVTAPSLDVPMVILGVNEHKLSCGHKVISSASSTLYCLTPIINILEENFGVSEGFITSIHAMTPSLKPLDGLCLKGKHWRDHRSIHQNIIPASTGACKALGKIIPQVKDKMTGLAFRVPIVNVSVLDITVRLKSDTTMDEIIRHIENADRTNKNSIIKVSSEQAVSSDFIGETYSCILDSSSSSQLTPDFFKLICWYENEYSYACRVIDSIFFLENQYQLEWKSKIAYMRTTPKQSLVHQAEYHKKLVYHQACSYDRNGNSKSLCSTSQDSGFKSLKRSSLTKKPTSCRNFDTKQVPNYNRGPKKRNELFKIWNDDVGITRGPLRNNRSSFFHSCVAITPQFKGNAYVKTQERLEKVKKDFKKMVNMTENLLKKSHNTKEKRISEELLNDETGNSNNLGICDELKLSLEMHKYNSLKDNCDISEVTNDKTTNDINLITNTQNNKANIKISLKDDYKREIYKYPMNDGINSLLQLPIKIKSNYDETSTAISNKVLDNKCHKLQSSLNEVSNAIFHKNSEIEPVTTSKERDEMRYDVPLNFPLPDEATCTQKEKGNNEFNVNAVDNSSAQELNSDLSMVSCHITSVADPSEDVINKDTEVIKIQSNIEQDKSGSRERNLQKRLEGILKKLAVEAHVISERSSICLNTDNAVTTIGNRNIKPKQDIYDKLDSISATDSENSFHMNERKSQVINITDLTNSLEDLDKLDKICRIIEISDDLSDQLLSALNKNERKDLQNKKWSFKDLCEKIKLDDFCNKMFSHTHVL